MVNGTIKPNQDGNGYIAQREELIRNVKPERRTYSEILDGHILLKASDVQPLQALCFNGGTFGVEDLVEEETADRRMYDFAMGWLDGCEQIDDNTNHA